MLKKVPKPFHFKQFTVHQDRCAMKIGTDGVLLGAWTAVARGTRSILDIGTGTGLIALQLAQRSSAQTIDAIELDNDAYEQCVENFEASSWADRLFCYHASFDEFVAEMDLTYDLIVCNPPFYEENVSSGDSARDMARQSISLPMAALLEGVSSLLDKSGQFAAVVPYESMARIIKIAKKQGLFVNRILKVRGNPSSGFKRSLLQFSRKKRQLETAELTIETERHLYTQQYIQLTGPFYLKM